MESHRHTPANRLRARSCALRASSSRSRVGAAIVSDAINFVAAAVTSPTAASKATSFAREGRVAPLNLRTN